MSGKVEDLLHSDEAFAKLAEQIRKKSGRLIMRLSLTLYALAGRKPASTFGP